MHACARQVREPNAYDYGASGAALFDNVNVHFGRGAEPRRPDKVASTTGAALRPFWQLLEQDRF